MPSEYTLEVPEKFVKASCVVLGFDELVLCVQELCSIRKCSEMKVFTESTPSLGSESVGKTFPKESRAQLLSSIIHRREASCASNASNKPGSSVDRSACPDTLRLYCIF